MDGRSLILDGHKLTAAEWLRHSSIRFADANSTHRLATKATSLAIKTPSFLALRRGRVREGVPYFLGCEANVGRPRTLGARLSYELNLGAGIQPVEVGGAAAVEEVVITVFGGNKPKTTLGNELLDGSRHFVWTSFPEPVPRAVEACSSGAHGERIQRDAPHIVPEVSSGQTLVRGA